MKLKEIAHSRTGDKGDTSCISVIAYDSNDFDQLIELVTVDKVTTWFGDLVDGRITRYEIKSLSALNFVMEHALGGGVTKSLAQDMHGKCLSSVLLDMEI